MHLWQLTLVGPTTVTAVASGSFTAAKRHELVAATPSALLLLRSTPDGRLRCLSACPSYGAVRAVAPVRLPGSRRDVLAVTADSGRLALLQLSATTSPPSWTPLHVETYGKSGVRRLVPGQYLVVDPRGRALLVAAVERQKFAVVLNRDAEAALTVASPLAAHKSRTATLGVVAADVGWENPVFVALERGYEPRGGPVGLVAYELDLGLNTVVRRALGGGVDPTASALVAVPGGDDGPGGVLVAADTHLSYVPLRVGGAGMPDAGATAGAAGVVPEAADGPPTPRTLRVRMLHRRGEALGAAMVTAATGHRQKGLLFFLFCTERGDLLVATLTTVPVAGGAGGSAAAAAAAATGASSVVTALSLRYLDSLPGPARCLSVLRSGFLFVAPEFGPVALYEFLADPSGVATNDGGFASSSNWTAAPPPSSVVPVGGGLSPGVSPLGVYGQRAGRPPVRVYGAADDLNPPPRTAPGAAGASGGDAAGAAGGSDGGGGDVLAFVPRAVPVNLVLVDELPGVSPALCGAAAPEGGTTSGGVRVCLPPLLVGSGRGGASMLRTVAHGVGVGEMASETLPGTLTGVWTLGGPPDEEEEEAAERIAAGDPPPADVTRFIVVSFVNASMVLRVGEAVEEAADSGLHTGVATLSAGVLMGGVLVQVTAGGVRCVHPPGGAAAAVGTPRLVDWVPPRGVAIVAAALNTQQVVVALLSGTVICLEMDVGGGGGLVTVGVIEALRSTDGGALFSAAALGANGSAAATAAAATAVASGILPIAIGLPPVPPGRRRASVVALADTTTSLVRTFTFDAGSGVPSPTASGLQTVEGTVTALSLGRVHIGDTSGADADAMAVAAGTGLAASTSATEGIGGGTAGARRGGPAATDTKGPGQTGTPGDGSLTLLVGTASGVLVRAAVSARTGAISAKRSRFLGGGALRLSPLSLPDALDVVVVAPVSSPPWLVHGSAGRAVVTPLAAAALAAAAPFASPQCPVGLVAVAGTSLRVLGMDDPDALRARAAVAPGVPLSRLPPAAAWASTFAARGVGVGNTPRVVLPLGPSVVAVVEGDHGAVPHDEGGVVAAAAAAAEAAAAAAAAAATAAAGEGAAKKEAATSTADGGAAMEVDPQAATVNGGRVAGASAVDAASSGEQPPETKGEGDEDEAPAAPPPVVGPPLKPAPPGMWSTALRLLSTVGGVDGGGSTLDVVRLDGSHCFLTAVSLSAPSTSGVAGAPPDTLLVASVARGMVVHGSAGVRRVPGPPPSPVTAELRVYRVVPAALRTPPGTPDGGGGGGGSGGGGGGGGDGGGGGGGNGGGGGSPVGSGGGGGLDVESDSPGMRLEHLHSTPVEAPVRALAVIAGRVVAGVGTTLRVFALGKRRLLRKAELRRAVPNLVVALAVSAPDRLWVADVQSSVRLVHYDLGDAALGVAAGAAGAAAVDAGDLAASAGRLVVVADDTLSRWVTRLAAVDYATVAVADKFGSIALLRLPAEAGGVLAARGGAAAKLAVAACVHLGSPIYFLSPPALPPLPPPLPPPPTTPAGGGRGGGDGGDGGSGGGSGSGGRSGGRSGGGAPTPPPPRVAAAAAAAAAAVAQDDPPLLYMTLDGEVGALAPLRSAADVRLLERLEERLRVAVPSVLGRDYRAARSVYYPVCHVIDGDLCEAYAGLPGGTQRGIAAELGVGVEVLLRRLEDLREGIA